MAIKRREKALTPEEAIALAKQEFLPYWFGSEPLMAGAREGNSVRVYPLDKRLSDRPWLLVFVDPLTLSSREVLRYTHEWATRYEPQKMGTLFLFRLPLSFCQQVEWGKKMAHHATQHQVTVMDRNGLLADAFGVSQYPKIILLSQNQIVFEKSGKDWFEGTELDLQNFFRKTDPGLPLFPTQKVTEPFSEELASVSLSGLKKNQTSFELPNGKSLILSGQWTYEAERLVTFDSKATMSFSSLGPRFGMTMQRLDPPGALNPSKVPAELLIEMNREFPRDEIHGRDLEVDTNVLINPLAPSALKRQGSAYVGEPRTYELFKKLPSTHRDLTVHFQEAEKVGVAIYGLRFGS